MANEYVNCEGRKSAYMARYEQTLELLAESPMSNKDLQAALGVDQAQVDQTLAMVEASGRLKIERPVSISHYAAAFSQFDRFSLTPADEHPDGEIVFDETVKVATGEQLVQVLESIAQAIGLDDFDEPAPETRSITTDVDGIREAHEAWTEYLLEYDTLNDLGSLDHGPVEVRKDGGRVVRYEEDRITVTEPNEPEDDVEDEVEDGWHVVPGSIRIS